MLLIHLAGDMDLPQSPNTRLRASFPVVVLLLDPVVELAVVLAVKAAVPVLSVEVADVTVAVVLVVLVV